MTTKKLFMFTLAVMMSLVMVVSGCSSQPSEGADTGDVNAADETAEEETIEITLGYYSSSSSDEKMKELIERFMEKHPNIKVTTQSAPYGQFYQKLDTQIAAESAPDVWLSDGVLVMKYAERDAAKDLTEWIERDLDKDAYYGLEFNKDTDGKYWAVPQGIQIGALFYNKDMFDEAGVDYPDESWTWDDLKETAAQLTLDTQGNNANESGFDPDNVKQFGLTFFSITEGWFSVLKSYGGGVLDHTMQQSIVDSPENKAAFEWMVDGMERGILTDPADLQSFQSPMSVFPSEAAAMRIGIYARVLAANETGIHYDVTLLPQGPDGKRFSPVIANSWMISNSTTDEKAEAAWEWIKYWVTEDDVQREWAALGEAVPVKKAVANSDLFLETGEQPENKQAFLDSFDFAGTLDANAVWSEWVKVFTDNMDQAFLGEKTIDEAMKQADEDVQGVLDDFYTQ